MDTVGERIRGVRRSASLSQSEFSEQLGVTQGHLSKIERGIVPPSFQLIKSICKYFGTSEVWLRDGIGSMSRKNPTPEEMSNEIVMLEKMSGAEVLKQIDHCASLLAEVEEKLTGVALSLFEIKDKDVDLMIVMKRVEDSLFSIETLIEDLRSKNNHS